MLGGLDGLTDEERGPCPLSVAQANLLVESCSVGRKARQREPCSLHLVFRWCSPPCLSSHARWLGWAHRCEERAMPSVWVPARRLVWIVSTGFPVLDLSWYLHACRPFNIMRASLIPFNHQSWSQCKPSTLLLVRGFVMTKNGIINVPLMENTSHAGYHDFVKKTTFNHN